MSKKTTLGKSVILTLLLCLAALVPLYTPSVQAPLTWRIETVDSAGDVGMFTSIALDSGSNPHISYHAFTSYDLKYAMWAGSSWSIETVDAFGIIGRFTSIALDSGGNPHISYSDGTDHDLKYARWTGSSWSKETVDSADNVGLWTSLALDYSGNAHISYYDDTNFDLKYARWTGSSWSIETVDSAGGVGLYNSIALDPGGNPRISYWDATNYDLKYARWTGSSWSIETVDSAGGVGLYTSIALGARHRPRISYYDITNGDLKYARWTGSSWSIETVDSGGDVGKDTSIALDSDDRPHISYYDDTNGNLKYAWWTGSSWSIETLDSAGDVGKYTSIALDYGGNPHISYYDDTNGDLKYAAPTQFQLEGAMAWYWDSGTNIRSVAFGDVDDDGSVEVVTGGSFYDGTRNHAQLCIWDGSTLALEEVTTWYWTSSTYIYSVAVGDVDGDSSAEIVTGGSYYAPHGHAQLCVWNGSTLALEGVTSWRWTSHTSIRSMAIGDVDADGSVEIVTGGEYDDGTNAYNAQLCVWDGSTLALEEVTTWNSSPSWTFLSSVAVGDVDGDGQAEIVTGGRYSSGGYRAQLRVWDGSTLTLEEEATWIWVGDTYLPSVALGDVDGDGQAEIVTGGSHHDAQLCVWNGSTLALEDVTNWNWGPFTCIKSVALGDVDGDGQAEIVTGGYYYDGTRDKAQLCIWDGSTLAIEGVQTWYWTDNTFIYSVALGNVDADGQMEIITGGTHNDGTRNCAQLVMWTKLY